MAAVTLGDLFHIGFRVADLSVAMKEYGEALGASWALPAEIPDQSLWTPDAGLQFLPLKFVYSIEGPVHIELVSGPEGCIWDGSGDSGIHHVGMWVGDISARVRSLQESGATLMAAARAPSEGFGNYAYLKIPAVGVIELVSLDVRPRMEAWWAGAAFV